MANRHDTLVAVPGEAFAGPVLFSDKNPTDSEPSVLLTIREVAHVLNISASGVRRLQQGRHIPFIKVGGCVRFAKDDIVVYLRRQRVESIGK